MNDTPQPPSLPAASGAPGALAWVSLVLGLLAFLLGIVIVGGVLGVGGLVVGIIYLYGKRAAHRAVAVAGVILSALGMILSLGIVIYAWMMFSGLRQHAAQGYFDKDAWIGKPLPDLTLHTWPDGRTIRTSELKGAPAVIDMWASWHPSCEAAVSDFNRLAAETSTQGVHVLAITFEHPDDVTEFVQRSPLRYPLVVTNDLPPPFGAVALVPTTFFVGADGVIRDIRIGYEGYEELKSSTLGGTPAGAERASARQEDQP